MTQLNILLPSGRIIKQEEQHLDKIPAIMKFINNCKKNELVLTDEYKFPIIEVDTVVFTDLEIRDITDFIFRYAQLYPVGKNEPPAPEYDFKIRHLQNLFEKKANDYFIMLLFGRTQEKQIDILLGVMDLAIKLEMTILANKAATLIALKLKDLPVDEIKSMF